jgi:hypothetical protein
MLGESPAKVPGFCFDRGKARVREPMGRVMHDPKHWRERAEKMRGFADDMQDPPSKQMMLTIAEEYENLAKRAEERLVSPKA